MEEIKVIESVKRLLNTQSGNPRYKVVFTDGTIGMTANDVDASYGIIVDDEPVKVTFSRDSRITHITHIRSV